MNFDYGLIDKDKTYLVALSGGLDSVCLTDLLFEYGVKLKAIHINHNLRKEAKRDEEFCVNLCNSYGISIEVVNVNVKAIAKERKTSLEDAGRIARYSEFEKRLRNNECDFVVLAHHKDDKVEGILLNLFKGTGLKGLSGIQEVRGKYVRPMLGIEKEELYGYAKEKGLSFVNDDTNFEIEFERNYIRNKVMPIISDRFPLYKEAVISLSAIARNDNDYLTSEAEKLVCVDDFGVYISVKDFVTPSLYQRAIFIALKKLGIEKSVYKKNIDEVTNLALVCESGKRVLLPCNAFAVKEFDKIVFYDKKRNKSEVELEIKEGEYTLDFCKLKIESVKNFEKTSSVTYFDFDKIEEGAIIRTRKDGDVFYRSGGKVKLKEYLIDKKVSISARDEVLVIVKGSEVLAVIGMECGKRLFVDKDSRNIYRISKIKTKEKLCTTTSKGY